MKTGMWVVLVVIAFFFGTCVGGTCTMMTGTATSKHQPAVVAQPAVPSSQQSATREPATAPTPPPALEAKLEFSGDGDEATDLFTLNAGLVRAKYTHNGESNFMVDVLDGAGNRAGYVANEIGACDGSSAFHVDRPGQYLLKIMADGQWSIELY
jgi:hypothetical protein